MDDQPARPEVDPIAMRLQEVLRAGDLASRAMARHLGLNLTDLAAMNHLMSQAAMGPAELAERLDLSSASTTALALRLERAGHVARRPHPGDRRRLVLEPTEHARAEAFRVLGPLIEAMRAASAPLSPSEAAVVEAWLDRARSGLLAFARELGPDADADPYRTPTLTST